MTDPEINKAVFSIVTGGKGCWHEWIWTDNDEEGIYTNTTCQKCGECCLVLHVAYGLPKNPDYLNNEADAYRLIQFVVNEWDDKEYENFISSVQQDEPYYNEYSFPRHLLKGTRALPVALARHEKEGEDE